MYIGCKKYGEAFTADFSLYEVDGVDLRVDAAHASGDSTVMKNEGVPANTTNGFVDEGDTYSITLTATEMECARGVIKLVDQTGTKIWLDITLEFDTFGHASAEYEKFPTDVISVAGTTQTANDNGADINTILSRIIGTLLTGNHNPQSGDSFSRIGVNGAGLSNIALSNQTMDITGSLSGAVGSVTAAVETDAASRTASKATGFATATNLQTVDDNVDTILVDTNELQTDDIPGRLTIIDSNISAIPTVMRGTNNAALATVATELRLAELDAANLPADIAAIPTTAMRGTNGANTAVPDIAGTAATLHGITDGKIDTMQLNVTDILNYESGDWEIVNDQMIFKIAAGVEIARYNLTKAGVPDSDSPDKRVKV